ncbi:hypothetical protein [uncultured Bacteroides sp.]|uniref:hypothetical protein n=1 Tax=uncultured Bacteroides sp. TaxID=162156 RepID=UPI002612EE47|nr:hypothetical protein [uncultured Bacteroides sp.]
MDRNTNTVGVVYDGTTVSVAESLTQIEIEIVNKIGIVTAYSGAYPFTFRRSIRA